MTMRHADVPWRQRDVLSRARGRAGIEGAARQDIPSDDRQAISRGGPHTISRGGPAAAAGHRIQRHRIFVAVNLAPELREAVAEARAVLGPAAARLRWVPPQNLHLTLRFLGPITETKLARVTEAAHDAVAAASPFSITLAGLGAFPTRRSPRVVWMGVTDGADRLVALAESLEASLRRRKFPAEPRGFTPHLTVARARSEGHPPDLTEILSHAASFVAGTQVVDALAVMESTLRPSGPVYQEVARATLGGGLGGRWGQAP